MDDPHKAIIKAKANLYGKSKLFATAIRMNQETFDAAKASICFKRTGPTKLVDSIQGLVITIDNSIENFELEDFYDPSGETDENKTMD